MLNLAVFKDMLYSHSCIYNGINFRYYLTKGCFHNKNNIFIWNLSEPGFAPPWKNLELHFFKHPYSKNWRQFSRFCRRFGPLKIKYLIFMNGNTMIRPNLSIAN